MSARERRIYYPLAVAAVLAATVLAFLREWRNYPAAARGQTGG